MIIDGKGFDGIAGTRTSDAKQQQHRKKETLSMSIPTAVRAGTQ
jgi:hypothetical protein